MSEIIHNMYFGKEGKLYCIKMNSIVNVFKDGCPCAECDWCFGSLQGNGAECKYEDPYYTNEFIVDVFDMEAEKQRVNTHLLSNKTFVSHPKDIVLYGFDEKYIPIIHEKLGRNVSVYSYCSDFIDCDLGDFLIANKEMLSETDLEYLSSWCSEFGIEFEFIMTSEESFERDLNSYINSKTKY